jgi:hypothetical protein
MPRERGSDPEAARELTLAAIRELQVAGRLLQLAMRMDRGDSLSPVPGELPEHHPLGTYDAQREAMLAMGNCSLAVQRAEKAIKLWEKSDGDDD